MKKKNTLQLFVLTVFDCVDTEVHLFSNWNSILNYVVERSGSLNDPETIKESLNETNAWVDEVLNLSYNVAIQGVED